MKTFFRFAVLQSTAYLILVANIRAIAHLDYGVAAMTESLYLLVQWTVLRRILSTESHAARAGYIVGGTCGTLLAMWLTRMWG